MDLAPSQFTANPEIDHRGGLRLQRDRGRNEQIQAAVRGEVGTLGRIERREFLASYNLYNQ